MLPTPFLGARAEQWGGGGQDAAENKCTPLNGGEI